MKARPHSLGKAERLRGKIRTDSLFAGGNKSFPAFPLRVVYAEVETDGEKEPSAAVLISVPKRRLHHAVDRNRVKRQVREAYRRHKGLLLNALQERGKSLHIAFIWLDTALHPSSEVDARMRRLLLHIADRLP